MKNLHIKLLLLLCLYSVKTEAQTGNCSPATQKIHLDINNVDALLLNGGDMWWDLVDYGSYIVPKGDSITSLFAGALWIGGIDPGGQLHTAAQTYRQNGNDFFPGTINASGVTTTGSCETFDHMWKVNGSTIDSFRMLLDSFGGQLPSSLVPPSILNWPARNNVFNPIAGDADMAPFYDANGDGMYDPTTGDFPVLYDGGEQYADQMIWWCFNDMGNTHTETGGLPLGVEVHVLAYAYKGGGWDCLNNATFYQYTLLYKGQTDLDSTYIGFWAEPDLGCYIDDYIGCDSTRNTGIEYNASAWDGGNPSACHFNYGNQPPVVGIDFLGGNGFPVNEPFSMTHFGSYYNDFSSIGNPQKAQDYYNYFTGTWKDSTHWTYGEKGYGGTSNTNFIFSGVPSQSNEWSMCSTNVPAGTRNLILSSGPYKFSPGDKRVFTVGVMWYQPPVGTYPCPNLDGFDEQLDCMKLTYDSNFVAAGIRTINPVSNGVTVYPNPASENITFGFSDNQPRQVTLYNMLGVEIKSYADVPGSTLVIKRDNLASGIYFYKVTGRNNEIQTGKLIFQ